MYSCPAARRERSRALGCGSAAFAAVGQRAFENIDKTVHGVGVGDLDGIDTT